MRAYSARVLAIKMTIIIEMVIIIIMPVIVLRCVFNFNGVRREKERERGGS